MAKATMKMLGMKDEEFYEGMGVYFITLAKVRLRSHKSSFHICTFRFDLDCFICLHRML